ncbi:MAG: folylpolyglutamate synthase/dihydrofolate synthase family protein [Balneolaceae bacterium]|nr:folylpolyglutamate synthase/dihydrofolate synthase family protein [Balneolaceae bacterium]
MKFNTILDVHRFLERIPKFQSAGEIAAKFDLDRFRAFCGEMGDPHRKFESIHVAGTNGKGGTCNILASIYQQAGYRIGVYTSPHLTEYRERFVIDGETISDNELLEFFQHHRQLIERFKLTYFEISTAVAFWWFSRRGVDLAVIEAGLGGRLDATNVVEPVASVITNVSLDHTGILGESIRDIAREKAGIIKKQIPLVLGNVGPEAREEIEMVAAGRHSPVTGIDGLSPRWESGSCILNTDGKELALPTDLTHPVNAYNIATAWRVVTVLQPLFPVEAEDIRRGVRTVGARYGYPGRFEKLHPDLDWYFDGAHNPEAVKAMVEAVSRINPPGQSTLILSIMGDKLNESVAMEFQKFKKIYYYELSSERAARMDDVKKWIPAVRPISNQEGEEGHFLKDLESELVIFAGSFYFYPTVRNWLQSSTVVR